MEFFLKSSLFGEWPFPGLEIPARILLILSMAISLIVIFGIAFASTRLFQKHKYIFLLNLLIPVLFEMKLRTSLPVACSQDFRYAAPILVSACFYLGTAIQRLKQPKFRIIYISAMLCIGAFCVFSAGFVLKLGNY
jgi:hypothetical protein